MKEKNKNFNEGVLVGGLFAILVMLVAVLLLQFIMPDDFTDAAQRALDVCPVAWEVYDLDWANGEIDLICEVD